MLNIPSDITLKKSKKLTQQNTELDLKDGKIDPKFSYTTKRGIKKSGDRSRLEQPEKLLQNRIKMGWVICKVDDYMVAKRCFRCGRFNHTHEECKGVEICPLCSGNHKLKEYTTPKSEYKCINCQVYNKHHTDD